MTVPEGVDAGSDVGNMALLGYDPRRHYTGRGPLEAAAMGVSLAPDEVAFRANTVTIRDGRLTDYSAGHIPTEEARAVVERVAGACADLGLRFHPGVQYRHLMVARRGASARTVPPHDAIGRPVEEILPSGDGADLLREVISRSQRVLEGHPRVSALWPWGQGRAALLPRIGARGVIVTAVDVVRGLGRLAGLDILDVPGATGYYDTDYAAKGEAAARALLGGADLAVVHVEAPDEAGHAGDAAEKVKAIESIDREILGRILDRLDAAGTPWRVLVAPDHATPLDVRTHVRDPVPYLLAASTDRPSMPRRYTEADAALYPCVDAWTLLPRLLA